MKAKRTLIAAAVGLALSASPAFAVLQRMGPINNAPTVGGFPAWFQDTTGITMDFCDLKSQAELDGGWCVLIPPGPVFPESFPNNFFNEHFYYDANNTLLDPNSGFKARLIIALEAAFANGPVVAGDQLTFARTRVFIPNLPIDGDYRVITPYSDITYTDQVAGDKIFETTDVGLNCVATFECTLGAQLGPFLLPSAAAGGRELPPMPDLAALPTGTDPFFDAIAAGGGVPTANPGTGRKYLADPARVGPITGSPLATFIANDTNGGTSVRNHNTFRVEIRHPAALGGNVVATLDGETNFTVGGRLVTGAIPGLVTASRGTYTANATGVVTELDAFASASPTVQARIPAQPVVPPTTPILQFYDVACGGALTVNPLTGATTVNPGPYTAPAGAVAHPMAASGKDYWGQSTPGGLPPSHLCIVDTTARNAAGQVVPAFYLQQVTDDVQINTAGYNGPGNGTLTVAATSSDPTAVLTLANFGPAGIGTPGTSVGRGAGTGLDLVGGTATVSALLAPPSRVNVISTRGGGDLRTVSPSLGSAQLVGVPVATPDTGTIFEDCISTPATSCSGAPLTVDLLANDTILVNGASQTLRAFANSGGVVTVTAGNPRLGTATIANGVVTYRPNPNANGLDEILYTVTVNGRTSNQVALSINVVPVNDLPVAGNTSIVAVSARSNTMSLILNSTDPDGNADVTNASIVTWPTQLGARPVPVNGVVNFTPTTTGNFSVTYRAIDAAGALSANTATGTVTVIAAETIGYTKNQFTAAGNVGGNASTRWTVTGTDTVRQGQTLTIAYADGVLTGGRGTCTGTAANPLCVVGTAVVDLTTGTWTFDQVGTQGGPKDPTDTATWATTPKNIRTFSSSPVLGGAQNIGILLK